MISFSHISKSFKTDFWARPFLALDDLSFSIQEGVMTGFLGANGAGKTTSIKIMMRFIKEDQGRVIFNDKLGSSQKEIFSNMGFVPERPYFYPHLTGYEFLQFAGELNNVSRSDSKKIIVKWMDRLQIGHAADRKIRGYSKGMLQRLGIISSLLHDPKIIILDEPLSGLDPVGRKEIKDVLVELNKEGKTIFFSSHIVSDVEEICQNVLVLEKGKVLYDGKILELIHDHIKPNYRIIAIGKDGLDLNEIIRKDGEMYFIECKKDAKNKLIFDLIGQDYQIQNVEQIRPTLEEIIYRIRS